MPRPPTEAAQPPSQEGGAWGNYKPGACANRTQAETRIPAAHHQGRSRWGEHKRELEQIDWNGLKIAPVRKKFLEEHPRTRMRTEAECSAIHLKHSIHIVNECGDDTPKPIEDMEEVPFPDSIRNVLIEKGCSTPTSIQVQAWPTALAGHDMVGIAETGSGKTMAFVPPMLVHILAQQELRPGEGPVGIILVPNRELCDQLQREIASFTQSAPELQDFRVQSVCGGADISQQSQAMLERVDIVLSTPGRLIHLLNDKKTNLRRATFVVLDEADELLSQGFEEQIRLILSQIRPDRQICLFSATWDQQAEKLAKEACSFKPVYINVGSTKLGACKTIEQTFRLVGSSEDSEHRGKNKLENLHIALSEIREDLEQGHKALVFCNRQETVQLLVEELSGKYLCAGLSGSMVQAERLRILQSFREGGRGAPRFLVATSLLGRGHHFPHLKYVLNYDMPYRIVEYVHRIGRTGRQGAKGYSMTLLEESDLHMASDLVRCLQETQQGIPNFFSPNFLTRLRRKRRENASKGPQTEEPSTFPSRPADLWNGRGRGCRHRFLDECQGQGAARLVVP